MKDKYLMKFESSVKTMLLLVFMAAALFAVAYILVFMAYVFGRTLI